jgi:hypothetical protein
VVAPKTDVRAQPRDGRRLHPIARLISGPDVQGSLAQTRKLGELLDCVEPQWLNLLADNGHGKPLSKYLWGEPLPALCRNYRNTLALALPGALTSGLQRDLLNIDRAGHVTEGPAQLPVR